MQLFSMKIHRSLVEVFMIWFLVLQLTPHFLRAETEALWENNC